MSILFLLKGLLSLSDILDYTLTSPLVMNMSNDLSHSGHEDETLRRARKRAYDTHSSCLYVMDLK